MNAIVIKEMSGAHSLKKEKFYRSFGKINDLMEVNRADIDKILMISEGGAHIEEYTQHHGLLLRGRKIISLFRKGIKKHLELCVFISDERLFLDVDGSIFDVNDIEDINICQFLFFGRIKIKIKGDFCLSASVIYPFWLDFWDDGQGEKYDIFPIFLVINQIKNDDQKKSLEKKLKNGYFNE